MTQTQLQPCAWCGDASEGTVEITPPRKAVDASGSEIGIHGREVPACAVHMAIPRSKPSPIRRAKAKQKEHLF